MSAWLHQGLTKKVSTIIPHWFNQPINQVKMKQVLVVLLLLVSSALAFPGPTPSQVFSAFDIAPKDDSITSEELFTVLHPQGVCHTKVQFQGLINEVDENGNGNIDLLSEVLALMEKHKIDYQLLVGYHQNPHLKIPLWVRNICTTVAVSAEPARDFSALAFTGI